MTAKKQVLRRWQRKVESDNWKWWHTSYIVLKVEKMGKAKNQLDQANLIPITDQNFQVHNSAQF